MVDETVVVELTDAVDEVAEALTAGSGAAWEVVVRFAGAAAITPSSWTVGSVVVVGACDAFEAQPSHVVTVRLVSPEMITWTAAAGRPAGAAKGGD